MAKSTMHGRAAVGGGERAGLEVVARRRAAERHVEVRVRVDAAGEDVLAAGVDDPVGALLPDVGEP